MIMSDLIPLTFSKVLQAPSHTVIILGTEEKKFAIYTEPRVGKEVQTYLTKNKKQRPSSLQLLQSILQSYTISPLQIVIHDVEDSVYFARLFLERTEKGKKHIVELDARPSDCISLALLQDIPIYCKQEAFEKAIAIDP